MSTGGSGSSKSSGLTINISSGIRKSPNSAFRSFLRTPSHSLFGTASTASNSSVSSPQLKNVLHPTGTVLNELQKLQLDMGDASAPSSTQSSASLDTSVSPQDAAAISPIHNIDQLKIQTLKIQENTSEDEPTEVEENDRTHKPLHRVTVDILDLFRTCNPKYSWSGIYQPRRVLTSPSVPHHTHPHDNVNNNLIMSVGDILWHNTEDSHVFRDKIKQNAGLKSGEKKRYVKSFKVMELLGEGTFGQVVKCEEVVSLAGERLNSLPAPATRTPARSKVYRAIKVIKAKPAYYNQALMEIQILKQLKDKLDPDHKHHLLRMIESFNCHGHLCLVFELLSVNLYDLMKQNGYRGLSWTLLRTFLKQILDALNVLHSSSPRIIHCDLKPENILLNELTGPALTLIDFGSACFESQTVYSYIQSRFYRAGEVLLGLPYTSTIDHWSFGCIAAELYLGLPLFPGITQQNQLYRIIKFIGPPPHHMLAKGKNTRKFFKIDPAPNPNDIPKYTLKSAEEYAAETHTDVAVHKIYFKGNTLKEVVDLYPMRKGLNDAQKAQELEDRKCFLHFLQGFLRWDPKERWTPKQAMQHPFLHRQPLSSINEHAFEQLRHVIDQPPSIPPAMPPPDKSTITATATATVTVPSSSTGGSSSSSSASANVAATASVVATSAPSTATVVPGATGSAFLPPTSAVSSSSGGGGGIGASLSSSSSVTTIGAALLTNQELANRQFQQQQQQQPRAVQPPQQQQQQHPQLSHQSGQGSSYFSTNLSSSMPNQSYVPLQPHQQLFQQPSNQQQSQQQSNAAFGVQNALLTSAMLQQQQIPYSPNQQLPYASNPQQIRQQPQQQQQRASFGSTSNFTNPAAALYQQSQQQQRMGASQQQANAYMQNQQFTSQQGYTQTGSAPTSGNWIPQAQWQQQR